MSKTEDVASGAPRSAGRYVLETDAVAVASGSFWWWAPYCVPGWPKHWTRLDGEYVPIDEARLIRTGTISRREAQALHRQGRA